LPNVQVNGLTTEIQKTDRGFAVLNRSWKSGDRVELRLPAEVRMIERPKRAVSLAPGSDRFGPFARRSVGTDFRLRALWRLGSATAPFVELRPFGRPQYHLAVRSHRAHAGYLTAFFFLGKSRRRGVVDYAPIKVTVAGKRVLQWCLVDASAGPVPEGPVETAMVADDLQLVPYGCTRIRIAEFQRVIA
jgi:hypothetical protein